MINARLLFNSTNFLSANVPDLCESIVTRDTVHVEKCIPISFEIISWYFINWDTKFKQEKSFCNH